MLNGHHAVIFEVLPFEYEEESEAEISRSSSEYIKWVQASLNQILSLRLAVDGISGSQTRSAIRSFQQQRGLAVDGIVGPQTEQALLAAGAPPFPIGAPPVSPGGGTVSDKWVLPPDIRAAGERQYIRYDGPPPPGSGSNCAKALTLGAAKLKAYILATFSVVTTIYDIACRQNTADPSNPSIHNFGRALDIVIPMINNRANSAAGDPIANWLIQNATALNVQYIIWNRTQWSGARSGRKDRDYTGPNPHIDHVHVELNNDGAARSTMPPVTRPPTSAPPFTPAPPSTSSRAQLAQQLLNHSRITLWPFSPTDSTSSDGADAMSNIRDTASGGAARRSSYGTAPGGSVNLDTRMLDGLLKLAGAYSVQVTSIAGGSHSSNSRHYAGIAFDINEINERHVSASHPDFRAVMQKCRDLGATEVLGPGNAGHDTHIHCAWPRP